MKYGAIACGLYADNLQYYNSGVYGVPGTDQGRKDCKSTQPNHDTVIVGYGSQNGIDFWIIQNSWSADWGEQGFFRIARNKDGVTGPGACGVLTDIFWASF